MWNNNNYEEASKILGANVFWADPCNVIAILNTDEFEKGKFWTKKKSNYEKINTNEIYHNEDFILWRNCSFGLEYYNKARDILTLLDEDDYAIYFSSGKKAEIGFLIGFNLTIAIAPRVGKSEGWISNIFNWELDNKID